MVSEHVCLTFSQLSEEQRAELISLVQVCADMPTIRSLMYNKFEVSINNLTIPAARTNFTKDSLRALGINPSYSACDRLLAFFRKREDLSFIAVRHSDQSGFVTMKKSNRGSSAKEECSVNETCDNSGIEANEIECWRNSLKVDDGKKFS